MATIQVLASTASRLAARDPRFAALLFSGAIGITHELTKRLPKINLSWGQADPLSTAPLAAQIKNDPIIIQEVVVSPPRVVFISRPSFINVGGNWSQFQAFSRPEGGLSDPQRRSFGGGQISMTFPDPRVIHFADINNYSTQTFYEWSGGFQNGTGYNMALVAPMDPLVIGHSGVWVMGHYNYPGGTFPTTVDEVVILPGVKIVSVINPPMVVVQQPSLVRTLAPGSLIPMTFQPPPAHVPWRQVPARRTVPIQPTETQPHVAINHPSQYQRVIDANSGIPILGVPVARPAPRPVLAPHEVPFVYPPTTIVIGKDAHRPVAPPVAHALAPPRPFEKERKVKAPAALRLGQMAFGTLTEVSDFINTVYKSVPYKHKVKYKGRYIKHHPSLEEQAAAIYAAWDDPDFPLLRVLRDLTLNEANDKLIGEVGQISKKISADLRPFGEVPLGFQFGNKRFKTALDKVRRK